MTGGFLVRAAAAPLLALAVVSCSTGTPASAPSTAAPASASPSVDLAHPAGIIAIGHSGLTGEGTGATREDVPESSWATGTDPRIDSVYHRMLALRPETEGHVANTAAGGAPASALTSQAQDALATVPAPALAIIQTVDNDIRCDASNVAEVGRSVAEALAVIHEASPSTKILVVGQLGRPDAAYVQKLVAHDPAAKAGLTWDDPCSFYDADGRLQRAGFARLTAAIDAYEAENARVCATVPNCATDGGVRRRYVDTIENFSSDYAHLNAQGQAAEAAQIWPVVEALLRS